VIYKFNNDVRLIGFRTFSTGSSKKPVIYKFNNDVRLIGFRTFSMGSRSPSDRVPKCYARVILCACCANHTPYKQRSRRVDQSSPIRIVLTDKNIGSGENAKICNCRNGSVDANTPYGHEDRISKNTDKKFFGTHHVGSI
jgi:hypothetical protein